MDSLNLAGEITTGITAGSTQTQAGATALTTQINFVSTVGTDDDGVALPKAVKGRMVWVKNDDAGQDIQVWPAYDTSASAGTGDSVAGGTADAAWTTSIGEGASVMFVAVSGTTESAGDWKPILSNEGAIA